jgi:uncharacterized protein (DUF2147 family)
MRYILLTFTCLIAISFSVSAQAVEADNADEIIGLWIVPERDAKVEVYKGENGKYHGKIVWLLEPSDENGKPRKDIHNKDTELAKRELIGLHVVSNFSFDDKEAKWVDGEVYNSRNGKSYAGFIKMMEDGTLFLRGHVKGLKFLGKTNIWERITE